MPLPSEYLTYSKRRTGYDHDWFDFRTPGERPQIAWPGGKALALWIVVPLEFFPLDAPAQPFRPLGGLDRRYPDYWSYSNRDYGNRIGIYRIARVLDRLGLQATAAVNAELAKRNPGLVKALVDSGWEIMAHGLDMAHLHHGGLERDEEVTQVAETARVLRDLSGTPVVGWHSPGHSQSLDTMDILVQQGFDYVADWINDDMPYTVTTPSGPIQALPMSFELSDRKALVQHDRTLDEYEANVMSAFNCLGEEAGRQGGRILSLVVTPWIMGYPHRIRALQRILSSMAGSGRVWCATGAEILAAAR